MQAQLDDIDVDAPRVGIVMGSKSDMETMEKAAKELEERGILHEVRVMSAHREPDLVAEYAKNARMRGLRVIIAGAGHLGGAAGCGRRAHRPARDRGAAVGSPDRGRRARRDPLDRADAARCARRAASGWTTRATPRSSQRGSSRAEARRTPARPAVGACADSDAAARRR